MGMRKKSIRQGIAVLGLFLLWQPVSGQGMLVLDGAVMRLEGGISLVVANSDPSAITRVTGGHIVSDHASNALLWKTGAGRYTVPWGTPQGAYIPFEFTLQGGEGEGGVYLNTYGTGWQNSATLPPGVPVIERNGEDQSAVMVDRLWRFEPTGFSMAPEVLSLSFAYAPDEAAAEGNTVKESQLQAFRWNADAQSWEDYTPEGNPDAVQHVYTTSAVPTEELHSWWFLASPPLMSLPVELRFFRAVATGQAVRLYWATASETNNAYFVVERSLDGKRFEPVLHKTGSGNSIVPVEYQAWDYPAMVDVPLYYRLRQVDFDDEESFSSVVSVTLKKEAAKIIVYPNPSHTGKLHVALQPGKEAFKAELYSVTGKAVPVHLTRKPESLLLEFPSGTPPGTYLLRLVGRQEAYMVKVLLL